MADLDINIRLPRFLETLAQSETWGNLHNIGKAAVYVGASALLLLVCLSNSLTRAFESHWSDCANVWAEAWRLLEERFSAETLFIWGTLIGHMVTFWSLGLFLMWADTRPNGTFLTAYKIQPGKNEPLSRSGLKKLVRVALRNQLLGGTLFQFPFWYLAQLRGCSTSLPLPSFERFVYEMAMFLLVEEVLFYYSHRLFHHKWLYGKIHKIHHEWTAPVGIAAIYCHPLEHLITNLAPIAAGPLLMGSHLAVMWVWYTLAVINTMFVHSGYHLPFLPSPQAHDFHHQRFNQNFGVLGILDYLHGTDKQFRASINFARHKTYTSFDAFPQCVARERQEKEQAAKAKAALLSQDSTTSTAAAEQ